MTRKDQRPEDPRPDNVELLSAQLPITDFKGLFITLIAAVLCFGIYQILPYDINANKGIAVLLFVAILWFTEAVHITVTALMVPVLAAVIGIPEMNVKTALSGFADPIIYIFFGGFALATALHMQRLDRKIALWLISLSRGNMKIAVLAIFGVTAFLSMWISNTATAAMMMPLALGMLKGLDVHKERRTLVFVLLGVAYSASIGGIGTLVGSPPNAIAAAQMGLGFTDWLKFGIPVVLIFMPVGIGLLYWVTRPNLSHQVSTEQVTIEWTGQRKTTLLIFLTTVLLWIGSQPIAAALGGIPQFDTLIAMGAILAIAVSRVASWDDINQNTDWGVLLLFGGGLTLSAVLKQTGANAFLAEHLSSALSTMPIFIILLCLAAFVVFLTELVSNTATAALLVPLFAGVAEALGVSPIVVSVLIAVGASCAFMLPVATPPNAIVFASGHIQQREMMRAGLVLNLVFTLILTLLAYFFGDILH